MRHCLAKLGCQRPVIPNGVSSQSEAVILAQCARLPISKLVQLGFISNMEPAMRASTQSPHVKLVPRLQNMPCRLFTAPAGTRAIVTISPPRPPSSSLRLRLTSDTAALLDVPACLLEEVYVRLRDIPHFAQRHTLLS